jgi:hypothetical protein
MRKIEKALLSKGYKISDTTIAELLREMGYTMQANRKELAIKESHPRANASEIGMNRDPNFRI